jgi:membrane protein YqaA with SNARE-associated domain
MGETASLWALFTSSFLAATLLPGGSEAVLYAVVRFHPQSAWAALAVATVGNTLGGMTSYLLGRLIPQTQPLRGLATLRRHGAPLLLLSWVPILGDPLCVAAGWLRLNAALSALFMALGKLARYCVILFVFDLPRPA